MHDEMVLYTIVQTVLHFTSTSSPQMLYKNEKQNGAVSLCSAVIIRFSWTITVTVYQLQGRSNVAEKVRSAKL